jgi:uncharacterized lipoprotein YajG
VKKISAIMAVLAVAAVFVFAGCQKQEAQKPAEPASAPTSTMPAATPGMK